MDALPPGHIREKGLSEGAGIFDSSTSGVLRHPGAPGGEIANL